MKLIPFLCGLPLAGLLSACCNPPLVATVDVPTLPQQASNWCWAASGQMTMRYLGHDVAQCTQANNRFGLSGCCNNNGGSCNNGGWPEYEKYGFTADQTSDTALTWAQVRSQIYCRKKPVAFSWHWPGGGGHMMVLKGYLTVGNVQYVDINDPLPHTNLQTLSGGTESVITYSHYVSQAGHHTHWNDYYNITYGGQ
ncbi:papain-like cysteine protease family protein [Massilia endophytica]|uniref:papain-like cysteine protease family protein n=1 Tax=Massilia endophytica TaxID=2899220 RepID=UPI001E5CE663|nr:papain-like cysteine protease family protein [Massilia endophytica]UGQ46495.1 C39 family peptidase [Massilia endophytica]